MTKSYLRYDASESAPFGIIASSMGNAVFDTTSTSSTAAALSPAESHVIRWQLRSGMPTDRFAGGLGSEVPASPVSYIATCESSKTFAVGHHDGTIRIWKDGRILVTFHGHRQAVTAIAFNMDGSKLASGSKDTDIVIWDVVSEIGICRLRGHKDQITSLNFLCQDDHSQEFILSTSKDTLMKVWDLSTQYCVDTIASHRSEVWSACVINLDHPLKAAEGEEFKVTWIITGSSDPELRIFQLNWKSLWELTSQIHGQASIESEVKSTIHLVATISRLQHQRAQCVRNVLTSSGHVIAVQTDRHVEMLRIKRPEEIKKMTQRRKRRAKEKVQNDDDKDVANISVSIEINDVVVPYRLVRGSAKLRSFDLRSAKAGNLSDIELLMQLSTNCLQFFRVSENIGEPQLLASVEREGHRGEITSVALTADGETIATAGEGEIRLWNSITSLCTRTLILPNDGKSLSKVTRMCFLPPHYLLVSTNFGALVLIDTFSSSIIENVQAHDGPIWDFRIRIPRKSHNIYDTPEADEVIDIISGGKDKDVKHFRLGSVADEAYSKKTQRASLIHIRTLRMQEEVTALALSQNRKLMAIGQLDNTIKVFYFDSFKFFLNLYGHNLPPTHLAIPDSDSFIVSAAQDKTIKRWGLDFGDCHQSIRVPNIPTGLAFLPNTHYMVYAAGEIVEYDSDARESIQKFAGGLFAEPNGDGTHIAIGTKNYVQMWKKTDDQIFIEEEKEREMDQEIEASVLARMDESDRDDSPLENVTTTRANLLSLKSGEKLMEALAIYESEENLWSDYRLSGNSGIPDHANPILSALRQTPEEYVLETVKKIRSADLEQALLVIPFTQCLSLLRVIKYWAQYKWNSHLTCRILTFLLKTYQNQIVINSDAKKILFALKETILGSLYKERSRLGYNIAAIKFVQRQWAAEHASEFTDWEKELAGKANEARSNKKQKKRKVVKVSSNMA